MIVTNKKGEQDRWVEEHECFFEALPPHETDCFYVNFLATFVLLFLFVYRLYIF